MHIGHTPGYGHHVVFFFVFLFFCFFINTIEIKKAKRNARTKKKKKKIKTIQQGWVEFTLTEYPSKADLPGPHYSLAGQSAREMALGIGH